MHRASISIDATVCFSQPCQCILASRKCAKAFLDHIKVSKKRCLEDTEIYLKGPSMFKLCTKFFLLHMHSHLFPLPLFPPLGNLLKCQKLHQPSPPFQPFQYPLNHPDHVRHTTSIRMQNQRKHHHLPICILLHLAPQKLKPVHPHALNNPSIHIPLRVRCMRPVLQRCHILNIPRPRDLDERLRSWRRGPGERMHPVLGAGGGRERGRRYRRDAG